jgi:hypothetical protein
MVHPMTEVFIQISAGWTAGTCKSGFGSEDFHPKYERDVDISSKFTRGT